MDVQGLKKLAEKRNRLKSALQQAEAELRRGIEDAREAGVGDAEIRKALGFPAPRLVRMEQERPAPPPRQSPPARADLDGWFDEP